MRMLVYLQWYHGVFCSNAQATVYHSCHGDLAYEIVIVATIDKILAKSTEHSYSDMKYLAHVL